MHEKTIMLKAALAIVAGLLCMGGLYWPRVYGVSNRRFFWEAMGCASLIRVGLFVAAFVVMHMSAQSDVVVYRYLTNRMMGGELVYRELRTPYAPLFHYVAAVPLLVWNSPLALILESIIIDLAAFAVWLTIGMRWFSPRAVRIAAVLAICSSISWVFIAINGQNQSWIALSLGLAVLALTKQRSGASGVAFSFAVTAVKFLGLLFVPILFFTNPRRLRWMMGFLIPTVLVYGFFSLWGDLLMPLKWVGGDFESGSFGYLLSVAGLDTLDPLVKRIVDDVGIVLLGALMMLAWWRIRRDCRPVDVVAWLSLTIFAFLFISKKSYPSYLLMAFIPACLTLAAASTSRWRLGMLWGVFGLAGSLEGSVYHRYMINQVGEMGWRQVMPHYAEAWSGDPESYLRQVPEPYDFRALWHPQFPGGPSHLATFMILFIDVVLLACYAWFAWRSWQYLTSRILPSAAEASGETMSASATAS